jgi:hypothetical protein
MNIFFLDLDPVLCARYHCDAHVVKMLTESAQMMSMAIWYHDTEQAMRLYAEGHIMNAPAHVTGKPPRNDSHLMHPCTMWVRESKKHFDWLKIMSFELSHEYYLRFGQFHNPPRHHSSYLNCIAYLDSSNIPDNPWEQPPQAMPDEYRGPDAAEAYRRLYGLNKIRFAKWSVREMPEWFKPYSRAEFLTRDDEAVSFLTSKEFKIPRYQLLEDHDI